MKVAALIGGLVLFALLYYGVRTLMSWVEKANNAMNKDNETEKKEDENEN